MVISKAPEIMVLHLKRFKAGEKKIKLSNKIKFPINNFNPNK